jgi:hypothetical protein
VACTINGSGTIPPTEQEALQSSYKALELNCGLIPLKVP